MTGKIRVPPEKGTEIVSDGGKKKNNFLLAFFFKLYIFISLAHKRHFDARIYSNSRCCSAPGVWRGGSWLQRLLQPAPRPSTHALAGSRTDPNPLIPFSPALQCWDQKYLYAVLPTCMICREDNILCSTFFLNESLCPKFNLLDMMDFFLQVSLQNIIARLKLS